MQKANLRGGLVGCGFFARNHLHAWAAIPGVEIVAVCDADPQRAEAFSRDFNVPSAYSDANEMLATEELDFVDIATQANSHRPLVELAAKHRVAAICQKPLANTQADAQAMVAACKEAKVPLMVHENFRWQRPMRKLKAIAHELGPLFFGRISLRSGYDVYANQPYLATDPRFIIADLGIHLLDLARFYFGEVEYLSCLTQRVNPKINGEDVATILLKMRSGATCIVDMSYASPVAEEIFPQTLVTLEGAKGTATLGGHYEITAKVNGQVSKVSAPPDLHAWSQEPGEVVQDSVLHIQTHWRDCLQSGTSPETSGEDNLRSLDLVYGAYWSAETGQIFRPGL